MLDGKVEIHFLHYHSEQEAKEKWMRRCKRINFSDLVIIGNDQNLCSLENIEEFSQLKFDKKIFFSSKNLSIPNTVFIKEYADQETVGDAYHEAHVFYRYLVRYASLNNW